MARFLLTAAGLSLSAAAAHAGGYAAPVVEAPVVAPVVAEAPAPSGDWTGFYAGGQYAMFNSGEVKAPTGIGADIKSGNAYGLHAGYLHDFGQFVGGAQLSWDKISGLEVNGAAKDFDGSMIKGQLLAGYDAGRVLPYVTVGASQLKLDKFTATGGDADGNGYFYGLGAKFKATENVLVGAEVLKHEFKDFNNVTDQKIDATTLGLNVSFKF